MKLGVDDRVEDYYAILGVKPNASIQTIKKAFRQRVKEQHPDVQKDDRSQSATRLLIQAYKTLSDPKQRADYDRTHHFGKRVEFQFEYREFLKSRRDDLASQATLIFYDLLHDRPADARELYEELVRERGFVLEDNLDREDFMDCAYLLSEIYEQEGCYAQACDFLRRIAVFEFQKPYFKHFFYEVERRLQLIVGLKMDSTAEPAFHLDFIAKLCALEFPKKFNAQLLKKSAEIYLRQDNLAYARSYLERALELDRRVPGAVKLAEALRRREGSYSFTI